MERTQTAVPKKTMELAKQISDKIREETGAYESCGAVIAKAVAKYHSEICKNG